MRERFIYVFFVIFIFDGMLTVKFIYENENIVKNMRNN